MLGGVYRERSSVLPGSAVWTRTVGAEGDSHRVLPDGCLDLIWVDGCLLVAGPDTTAQVAVGAPGASYTGLRFAPGVGPAVLGVPAHELRDRRVPLADLWPSARVRRLTDQVGAAARRGRFLEEVAAERLRHTTTPPDPALPVIVAGAAAGEPVTTTAERVGVGARQLHRRCRDAFGYGPKTLARVLRLRRALALARSGVPFAEVAGGAGYADQAHLAREVRALAGVPLGDLVRPAA
ncbi:transcriptional regulator, AraC family [Streptoalloteichus tenebrarius]|uniref:Transcriptional regulator, AraC family n=1 Tax=Streptoalloteichus tenebrarius (strain ATCC 17920 / DSM 40477 / JCM 4838 / CBS 697.72 / NBRC 16177 / NCIMB 11028 / NRRL B-12390 / A12253. 1 / ISP 5477) TaxID=1933 RepID=A0ABT1HU17_STRSD|nr:helix-turn-helix domain-containing protein [Streptoalloteichus tenebrarius]MCP2259021.1 transcriptional regulator, AraC family [Streptoalloteichus tenebrarius]BFE99654.1 helix-turn-helix transcriptional regulator [Streptoalloteichus tenebrarius]